MHMRAAGKRHYAAECFGEVQRTVCSQIRWLCGVCCRRATKLVITDGEGVVKETQGAGSETT